MSRPPETLTIEESEKLLTQLKMQEKNRWFGWKSLRNYAMTLLMLDAGLRVGEVVILKIPSLIINGDPVSALDLTGNHAEKKCERLVPLSDRLKKALSDCQSLIWKENVDPLEAWVFFDTDTRKHITTRQVQRIIGKASLTAFGRAIHPHVLRHTFATRLMRVTNQKVVQQLLGHKHSSSTEVYMHPNGDDCKKAIEKMNTNQSEPSQ
jgi:integrase/recombinase XerD